MKFHPIVPHLLWHEKSIPSQTPQEKMNFQQKHYKICALNSNSDGSENPLALAIFDLDNTLIRGDSDHAWGEFMVQKGLVDPKEYQRKNDYFYRQYRQGELDILAYLEFALKPLAQHSKQALDQWQQEFMQTVVADMMLPRAIACISAHRAKGDDLLIITATNRFVTEPIAHKLGITELLASEPEYLDGQYTGEVVGVPCFQEGKVTRLESWLSETGNEHTESYFYSDSHNDLPLLKQVDHPIAVDPDDRLTQEATKRGWEIISFR